MCGRIDLRDLFNDCVFVLYIIWVWIKSSRVGRRAITGDRCFRIVYR